MIRRPDGRILAISRGKDTRDWGLPGGSRAKRDPDLATTAIRELAEETGIRLEHVIPVFEGESPAGGTRVVTFAPVGVTFWPDRLKSKPFEGYVGWVPPELLVSPEASHAAYAARMLEQLGIIAG